MNNGSDGTFLPTFRARPSWGSEQIRKLKRQLGMPVEEGRSDQGAKKKRQDNHHHKGAAEKKKNGKEADVKDAKDAKEVSVGHERHCRLVVGPALGTRSMTRWRATAKGLEDLQCFRCKSRTCSAPSQQPPGGEAELRPPEMGRANQDDDDGGDDEGAKEMTPAERYEASYSQGELIGHGGYGSVYAGHRKSDHLPVALKIVDVRKIKMWAKMSEFKGPIPLEIALLRQVCRGGPECKGIAQLLDYVELPGAYVMVLERPEPCQDLFNFMQSGKGYLDEAVARHVLQQLVRVLLHCHARGVVHRDVKPENILVVGGSSSSATRQIKLLDFGSASVLRDGPYMDISGTPEYFPPEAMLRGEYFAVPATVWSLGILLFQMVWGDVPFYDEADIQKGLLYFPRRITRECRHLIRLCLAVSPKDRPTLEQILAHPWMA